MACWIGKEELKQELIKAATELTQAGQPLSQVSDGTYFNNVVKAHVGKSYDPAFNDVAAAHLHYRQLVNAAVKEHGINIAEVRYITMPIIGTDHPKEMALLEQDVQRARAKQVY